jgi:hypothetical protein
LIGDVIASRIANGLDGTDDVDGGSTAGGSPSDSFWPVEDVQRLNPTHIGNHPFSINFNIETRGVPEQRL